jgi:hypothetical protein
MFGPRKLFRGIAQLVERRPLESDVGGSNPSTPANNNIPVSEAEPFIFNFFNNLLVATIPPHSLRVRCIQCKDLTGIVMSTCYNEVGFNRTTSAMRVACPKCSITFRIVINPVQCLGCPMVECGELPQWNLWEL